MSPKIIRFFGGVVFSKRLSNIKANQFKSLQIIGKYVESIQPSRNKNFEGY